MTVCKGKHRLKRGIYECGYCGNEIGPKEFDIDHENPCVAINENRLTGYDYNGVIERMFDEDNLVLTCRPCHKKKTGAENSKRKKGVPNSKEHIENAAKTWTKKRKKDHGIKTGKPVRCITTGEEFTSQLQAEYETGVCCTNIGRVCTGERETAGGVTWEWI